MPSPRFVRFAWFFVAYLIVVILFGAWVRIAGAGAGCGNHWPTCNGDVIPQAPEMKTVIEYTHRVTSGLCGLLVLGLAFWARRVSRPVFYASLATLFFILVESFIGAVLVKKELVAGDASVSRAIVISLHLLNTMLLTAAAATVAWWASRGVAALPRIAVSRGMIVAVLLCLVLTSVTGAVTALGDTLFPKQPALDGSLIASVRGDLSVGQHFLVRLRVLHPLVAVISAMIVLAVSLGLRRQIKGSSTGELRLIRLLKSWQHAVLLQLVLGVVNIMLAAPGWMQIFHLLMAQALWLVVWVTVLDLWPGSKELAREAASLGPRPASGTA
jgi:heme A synthase